MRFVYSCCLWFHFPLTDVIWIFAYANEILNILMAYYVNCMLLMVELYHNAVLKCVVYSYLSVWAHCQWQSTFKVCGERSAFTWLWGNISVWPWKLDQFSSGIFFSFILNSQILFLFVWECLISHSPFRWIVEWHY